MIDEIDTKEREQKVIMRSRFALFSHVNDLALISRQILSTALFAFIIFVSFYKIACYGIYEWLKTIVYIVNSLEWTSISMLIAFGTLKTIHSIFNAYFKNKNSTEEIQ